MPTIPDSTSLGRRPTPRNQQGVVSIDTSGAQRDQAAAGALIQQAGEQFRQIGERIQTRTDTIERARDIGSYVESAENEWLRLSTEDDITKPEVLSGYKDFLDSKRDEISGSHKGSGPSQAALISEIERQKIQFISTAGSVAAAEQDKMVGDMMDRSLNALAEKAYANPGSFAEQYQGIETELENMAGALTPDQEREYRSRAREHVATMSIQSLLLRGDLTGVEQVMRTPGVLSSISQGTHSQIHSAVESARERRRREAMKPIAKGVQDAQNDMLYVSAISASDLPFAMKQAMIAKRVGSGGSSKLVGAESGVADAQADISFRQTIMDNPDLTDEQKQAAINDRFKVEPAGGEGNLVFGKSQHGRARAYINDLATSFGNGLTTPEEDRLFVSSIEALTKPMVDEFTGKVIPAQPIPSVARQAYQKRGYDLIVPNTVAPTQPEGADLLLPSTVSAIPIEGGDGDPVIAAAAEAQKTPAAAGLPADEDDALFEELRQMGSLWEIADDAIGPIPAIASGLKATPVIGPHIETGKFAAARSVIPRVLSRLVNVMRTNDKYGEMERQDVVKRLRLDSLSWNNAENYRISLATLDQIIRNIAYEIRQSAGAPGLTPEQRKKDMDTAVEVERVLPLLGVRRIPRDPAQRKAYVDSLQPGQWVVAPDGYTIFQRKENQPSDQSPEQESE